MCAAKVLPKRVILFSALVVSGAMAQNMRCANDLTLDELRGTQAETAAISNDFRDAFTSMSLDTATSTVSTVGATLVGSALANEVSAAAEGLRHMAALRDDVQPVMRDMVVSRLAQEMAEAGIRMRRVSSSYGQVSKMANLQNVRDLAASAMQYTDTLSKRWSCK